VVGFTQLVGEFAGHLERERGRETKGGWERVGVWRREGEEERGHDEME